MDNFHTLTVSQLNEYAKSLLERDPLLRGLTVRGEVSGFKRHSSGHLYFSLKDDGALIRCAMFRQNAQSLQVSMRDGMEVLATGSVSLYPKDGQYQLYVRAVEEAGEGALYRRFMLLKTRLEAQGLFDVSHKKPLPFLPSCVGVITSPTGAALQDIITVTRRRFPSMNLILYPAKVQGEGAAEEIARAIYEMNRLKQADVLIVGRGGGSMEDLWAFNEEVVARAIYESEIPVVSAVGHETDFSIADFVSDLRAPTPSAAAELCVPEYAGLKNRVDALNAALRLAPRKSSQNYRAFIAAAQGSSALAAPKAASRMLRQKLEGMNTSLQNASRAALVGGYGQLDRLKGRMEALSPMQVLGRGYALVKGLSGNVLMSAEALKQEGEALVVLRDGDVCVQVKNG